MTFSNPKLSDRIRPDVDAATWVVEGIEKLERQLEQAHADIAGLHDQLEEPQIAQDDYRLNKLELEQLRQQVTLLLELANRCRIELVVQIHELADHIERARGCITDPDMLKQINGQREYALKVSDNWNQNGNPFEALAAMEPK